MKLYGCESEDSDLISLNKMTVQVTIDELKNLSEFISNTIIIMESNGEGFGHEHFSDFIKSEGVPDIIITK